jgi:uncharacterized protein YqeY
MTPAETLKLRLRSDLTMALRRRERVEISTLRALIGAVDTAEAVPPGDRHARYVTYSFGDPATEIPRRSLTSAELQALLSREDEDRTNAAKVLDDLGHADRAADLLAQARIIRRYGSD